MKIQKFSFYLLHAEEAKTYLMNIREQLQILESGKNKLGKYLQDFLEIYDKLIDMNKADVVSNKTEALAEADRKRDLAFLAFRTLVEYHMYKTADDDNHKNIQFVDKLIDRYGASLHSESYTRQTANMVSLISDLRTNEDAILAVQSFGLEEDVQAMETSQAFFEQISNAKVMEKVVKADKGYISEHRLSCFEALDRLFDGINVMSDLMPSPEMDSLIQKINAVNEDFSIKIQSRKSRKKNQKTEEVSE